MAPKMGKTSEVLLENIFSINDVVKMELCFQDSLSYIMSYDNQVCKLDNSVIFRSEQG